jgi:hypothetical protein
MAIAFGLILLSALGLIGETILQLIGMGPPGVVPPSVEDCGGPEPHGVL